MQALFYAAYEPVRAYGWNNIAFAASTSASPKMEGATFTRSDVSFFEALSNKSSVILEGVVISPYASFLAPPDQSSTAAQMRIADHLTSVVFKRFQVDWQCALTSMIMYGPPKYHSVISKVMLQT